MTDARAWLGRADTLTNAATDGPWEADLTVVRYARRPDPRGGRVWTVIRTEPDAEFVAAARTGWPASNAGLRAVLDLAEEADEVARRAADNNPEWADAHSTMAACIRTAITTALEGA
jgi:hypothetical protein